MYKYIDSWSPYSKVTFSWASNREIKDYLEFASKSCDNHHIRERMIRVASSLRSLTVTDRELTHLIFTKYTDSSLS